MQRNGHTVTDLIFGPLLGWAIAAILLFWAVGAYNRLVRLRGKVLRIFATLALQFDRYAAWMQAHAPGDTSAAAAPVADLWTGLSAAQAQFTASLAVARARPGDGAAVAALSAARLVLSAAWQRMGDEALAVARRHEDVGEDISEGERLTALRSAWEQIDAQTRSTDKAFALAVSTYNRAVRQFPAVLVAWVFGLRPAQTL